MELLLSKNPIFTFPYKTVKEYYRNLIEDSDEFNIATGFVTNDSLVSLDTLIRYRQKKKHPLKINLLIGMDYLEKFTRLQYDAVKELNAHLITDKLGKVMVSKEILYHGKMYSFIKDHICDNAFIGSSNLGSFVGTSDSLIESDVLLKGNDANLVNQQILNLYATIGTDFCNIEEITEFKEPPIHVLDHVLHVKKVSAKDLSDLKAQCIPEQSFKYELKTEEKSNLNTWNGAGKIKDKYSPRSWYEVELIMSEKESFRDKMKKLHFPYREKDQITVITDDGYEFTCSLQGGNKGKNFRSDHDLKILGKWIKGHMESAGALKLNELVTSKTLEKFGKSKLVFIPIRNTNYSTWLLKME